MQVLRLTPTVAIAGISDSLCRLHFKIPSLLALATIGIASFPLKSGARDLAQAGSNRVAHTAIMCRSLIHPHHLVMIIPYNLEELNI